MQTLTDSRIRIVALASLCLGFLFDYFFFQKRVGISLLVYIILLSSAPLLLLRLFRIEFNRTVYWYMVPLVFFSGMAAFRDSPFLLFWNCILILSTLLIFIGHICGRSILRYGFIDYLKTAFVLPISMFSSLIASIGRLFGSSLRIGKNERLTQVVRGIAITIPILLVFILLLSSADLVFGRLVSNFNIHISASAWQQILIIAVVSAAWLGSLTYSLENSSAGAASPIPEEGSKYKFSMVEVGILLGATSVLFLVFVIIQIKYLFAGHGAIASLGYTYADYAHKGFAELILVSFITLAIIFITERNIIRTNESRPALFKALCSVLTVLIVVIMASAFLRLYIYEQAYSFTLLRIFVQAFIIWLAAVFAWLLVKIFLSLRNSVFLFGVFLSVLAFFAVFNLLDPEAYVARKNIEQFAAVGKLDLMYLSSLSADAVPEIARLVDFKGLKDDSGRDLSDSARSVLEEKKVEILDADNQHWQSFNISRVRALKIIEQKLNDKL